MRLIACALCLALAALPVAAACPPKGATRTSLLALKAEGFRVADNDQRQAMAIAWLDCLGDADPALRDGVAYEGLATWLRGNLLDADTRRALLEQLLPMIAPGAPDPDGFSAPFAALALSEVARTDRVAAWMTPGQRASLVDAAVVYLPTIRDYRGFHPSQGWRHGVAHGADLLMQLALNPALDDQALDRLLGAVASQLAPASHAYVDGESERLLRPVVFVLQRGVPDGAAWSAWVAGIAATAPLEAWSDAFASEAGLARRHNLRSFLFALYATLSTSGDPALEARVPPVLAALRETN